VSRYSPEHSHPEQTRWFFLYTVEISNEGTATVQLLSRHWIVEIADHLVEEVRGPGVVGQQPVLGPGESFEYTSGCPLAAPFGSMRGTYQMVTQDGGRFDATIAPFTLSELYGALRPPTPTLPRSTKRKLTARTADNTSSIESVQSPESDARFFTRYFKKLARRPLRILREDFCGTALLCCEFVRLHKENIAIGVDLDTPTLRWAHMHNLSRLPPKVRERVHLARANVLDLRRPKVDAVAALNFSYSVFKTRRELGAYIKTAYASLSPGGVLFLDAWGGGETQFILKEKRRLNGFDYVWDQAEFDPITHEILCKIHFEFRDGTACGTRFSTTGGCGRSGASRANVRCGLRERPRALGRTDRNPQGKRIFRRVDRGDEKAWVAWVDETMTLNRGFHYQSVWVSRRKANPPLLLERGYRHSSPVEWQRRIEDGLVLVEGAPARADRALTEGESSSGTACRGESLRLPRASPFSTRMKTFWVAKPRLPTLRAEAFENTLLARAPPIQGRLTLHRLGRGTSGIVPSR
jgi:uncharacterized protein affecting Mg2+/Co2+ transport/SAM-dependent methyltransferase